MDIKLKNNHKKRIIIAMAVLLGLTVVNMLCFPGINRRAAERLNVKTNNVPESVNYVNTEMVTALYQGCYVLYMEEFEEQGELPVSAADVYIAQYANSNEEQVISSSDVKRVTDDAIRDVLDRWQSKFESYRSIVDYCVLREDGSVSKNTQKSIEDIGTSKDDLHSLQSYYNAYFRLSFDKTGNLEIDQLYSKEQGSEDALLKAFLKVDRKNILASDLEEYIEYAPTLKELKNFEVIFAIPQDLVEEGTSVSLFVTSSSYSYDDYMRNVDAYIQAGGRLLYVISMFAILLLVFIMTSPMIWKEEISLKRPGNWHLLEIAFVGIICVLSLSNTFLELIWQNGYQSFSEIAQRIMSGNIYDTVVNSLMDGFMVLCIYVTAYLSMYFIRPVFSLGLKEYIKQYSFIYQIFPWVSSKWGKLKIEVEHIDFSEKSTKTIVKIVVLNFVILVVCSLFWFFGIGALIIYSIVLFFIIKKYYDRVGRDYRRLLWNVNKIAEGDLDTIIAEDLGVFEPFKAELSKIQNGFKKAVDEEVKSQRMKTELITNVSHDLKTPLTAITTYIELLKKEGITEEERRSYIETLEKKSLRLKVLIEDLFEVSKATSNNIVLNPMALDVVNLMKQVSIEHNDKIEEKGLELRWKVPEEKVILMLDNQKTYRVFENLFVNVEKYAMPGSRVYMEVKQEGADVEIAMKNMSAEELNFKAEEITERFVRGDSSRNTEGSGLGLAIAKSFTEAQKGKFAVEVDGDLFKVVIRFKCDKIEDSK